MAALQSVEGVEELNTLAAPRLLAVDGADARIIIGGQLGFFVTTTVENTVLQSVQFLDTGTAAAHHADHRRRRLRAHDDPPRALRRRRSTTGCRRRRPPR